MKSQNQSTARSRFWEIDTLRGVAIITMILFHLMWDLWFFRILPNVVLHTGFWKYVQRFTAISFLFLVGVSLTISYNQAVRQKGDAQGLFTKFAKRGVRIFGWGMVFSLVVWGFGIGYVHFGVLHLIGVAIIITYPLITYRWVNFALWLLLYTLGGFIQSIRVDWIWLVWLGFRPEVYTPVDYFPLIPWLGVILLGIFVGNMLYGQDGRKFGLPDFIHAFGNWLFPSRTLQFLGRHSLTVYLIHQPLLFAILYSLGLVKIG